MQLANFNLVLLMKVLPLNHACTNYFILQNLENEHHFTMEYGTYDSSRQSLFIKISETENQFSTFEDSEKSTFLLSNPDTAKMTSEYLRKTS